MAMALSTHTLTPPAQLSTFFHQPLIALRCVSRSSSRSPRPLLKINGRGGQLALSLSQPDKTSDLSRKDFPSDFLFGAGSSAFQVEGAPTAGGRGMSIWDSFVHRPGKIANGALNYPGSNFYKLYEEDIQRAKEMGFNAFRLSISWTRMYPDYVASKTGQPSGEGIEFYNRVINAIVRAGLTPWVTLFHWEIPQYLENHPDVLGLRTKNIVPHFVQLADTCFQYFGDRVKFWATINEIWTVSRFGYGNGAWAPGRCSSVSGSKCPVGDSQTEPYLVAHHLLLAHAQAYKLYKTKYKAHQQGLCGYNPVSNGAIPYSDKIEDIKATQRYLEFVSGWQIQPVVHGDYPDVMRKRVGDRLPTFTIEEREDLKNSFDFLAHNYYTAYFIKHAETPKDPTQRWYENDGGYTTSTTNEKGEYIGPPSGPSNTWIHDSSEHLPPLLEWLEHKYGNIPCYITENGTMDRDPKNVIESLDDPQRITYIKNHLMHIKKARDKGINVKGYFYWSYLDSFEWETGYLVRFGLIHVDFEANPPTRTFKLSAKWFKDFLTS